MITLKAGDIRRAGDQVRYKGFDDAYRNQMLELSKKNAMAKGILRRPECYFDHNWRETYLIGHEIMPSDVMYLEFRRP